MAKLISSHHKPIKSQSAIPKQIQKVRIHSKLPILVKTNNSNKNIVIFSQIKKVKLKLGMKRLE